MFISLLVVFTTVCIVWFSKYKLIFERSIDDSAYWMELSDSDMKKYKKISVWQVNLLISINTLTAWIIFFIGLFVESFTPFDQLNLTAIFYILYFVIIGCIGIFEPYIFSFERKPTNKNMGIDIWNYYAYKGSGKNKLAMFAINTQGVTQIEQERVKGALKALPNDKLKNLQAIFKTGKIKNSRQILSDKIIRWISSVIAGLFSASLIVKKILDIRWAEVKGEDFFITFIIILIIASFILFIVYFIASMIDLFTKTNRRKQVDSALSDIFNEFLN